jgi:hypothetical protein
MVMPKLLIAGLALAAAGMLIACRPVVSTAPIGTTVGMNADPRLLGIWVDAQSGDNSYFANTPDGDGAIRSAMCDEPTAQGCDKYDYFRIHTARPGAYNYIDAAGTDAKGRPLAHSEVPGHVPLAYAFDAKGQLVLYLMASQPARDAVRAGKIAGVVTKDRSKIEDVTLTAPAAQLDAFLATPEGHALFTASKPLVLKKQGSLRSGNAPAN